MLDLREERPIARALADKIFRCYAQVALRTVLDLPGQCYTLKRDAGLAPDSAIGNLVAKLHAVLWSPRMRCPVCDGTDFEDFKGRIAARCLSCTSLERIRLLWMMMEHFKVLKPGLRVLHLAPEKAIADRIFAIVGDGYYATDVDLARYKSQRKHAINFMDACKGLSDFDDGTFDLIIHNHVMEHVPCSVSDVLDQFQRVMKRGGWHFMSVPFSRRDETDEELGPMSDEEREARFRQSDHLRLFGQSFSRDLVGRGFRRVNGPELFSDEQLMDASIPIRHSDVSTGETIFAYQKQG